MNGDNVICPLRVDRVVPESDGVISLRLVHPDGQRLPDWTPGAHLDVLLPSGLLRQYSLCGDPQDDTGYRIAVLREARGRGGSREIHDSALLGCTLGIRGPRNHFALSTAPRYLFLAGGIGITPILAMAREVSRRGVPWRLVYGGRTRSTMAFVDELQNLPSGQVELVPQDERGHIPLDDILAATPPDTHIYCCGPEPMIRAVEAACARCSALDRLHVERFTAPSLAEQPPVEPVGDGTFEVELHRSGVVLRVPANRTLLEVVRDVVPGVMSSCEEGFCGACETKVLEGVPEHHDSILSDAERASCNTMMICVGRARSGLLVLDL
ncbi:PDR/VanB family oxidoreductase (plasmid) [Rhodococcus opacus]|uniref:Oxidoreductase n=1 Tax=Rhodococcus pseudokoreensis TaxID=2811421 RepID=A0A974VY64_9NOCA|nr:MULTISPECIES: PDR/VanB family oxidoreductase [Rhodococcus]QSE87394.1 oxidoreductase [Rhodococcus pseudokoreensis]WKN60005.1 PDR/VanB family oxidoreductase [Rhodococcus opacus]